MWGVMRDPHSKHSRGDANVDSLLEAIATITDYSVVCIPSTSIRRMPEEAMVAGSSDDMRKAVNDKPTWKGRNMFVFAQLILVQMGTTRKAFPGRTGVKKWKRSNDPTRRGQAPPES